MQTEEGNNSETITTETPVVNPPEGTTEVTEVAPTTEEQTVETPPVSTETTEGQASSDGSTTDTTTVETPSSELEEVKLYPHQEIIADENIVVRDLPKPIKQDIQMWNATLSRFKKQNTPKLHELVIKKSVLIADAIQDLLEKELPEEEQVVVPPVEPQPTAEQIQAENEQKEREENQRKLEEAKKEQIRLQQEADRRRKERINLNRVRQEEAPSLEKQILNSLDDHKTISYNELRKIMGKTSLGFSVKVGSVVLYNQFMTNDYYLAE